MSLSVRLLFVLTLVSALGGSVLLLVTRDESQRAARINDRVEALVREVESEAARLASHPDSLELWSNATCPFFLIRDGQVLLWSDHTQVPQRLFIADSGRWSYLVNPRGHYLVKSWTTPKGTLQANVPLLQQYRVSNQYLSPTWNSVVFEDSRPKMDTPAAAGNAIRIGGVPTFTVRELPDERPFAKGGVLLLLLAIVSFLMIVDRWLRSRSPSWSWIGMAGVLVGVRLLMIRLDFFRAFRDYSIFDPQVFASAWYNPTLADFALNLFVLAVVCWQFQRSAVSARWAGSFTSGDGLRISAAIAMLFLSVLGFLHPFLVVEALYHNSGLTLEITESIRVDLPRTLAFASVALSCAAGLFWARPLIRAALQLIPDRTYKFMLALAALTLFFLFSLSFGRFDWVAMATAAVGIALIGTGQREPAVAWQPFRGDMLLVLLFALQVSVGVRVFAAERSLRDQVRYATTLADQDVLAEFLLNEAIGKIRDDRFIQAQLSSAILPKGTIRGRIIQNYLSSYFNQYDVRILIFNPAQSPVAGGTLPWPEIERGLANALSTEYAGVYYHSQPDPDVVRQYSAVIPFVHEGQSAGTVVLQLRLKKELPRSVYPELLVDNRFGQYLQSRNFSYAYFREGKWLGAFGDFDYVRQFQPVWLHQPALYRTGIVQGQAVHVATEDASGRVTVVTSERYTVWRFFSNLSFWLFSGLIIWLAVVLLGLLFRPAGAGLPYAFKIQLYLLTALFVPVMVLSIVVVSVITRQRIGELRQDFVSKARQAVALLEADQSQDSVVQVAWAERVVDVSQQVQADLSVFDSTGHLRASSQPAIFSNLLWGPYLNVRALAELRNKAETVVEEHIGALTYQSVYVSRQPFQGNHDVVQLPFFGSSASIEAVRLSVITTVLTVTVWLMLLFMLLSLYAIRSLVKPIQLVASALERTSWLKANQPIPLTSTDELGQLAARYNQLLANLERSKAELARNQREAAWREMAQQVAHEIKNPLTPMRLSLQRMELDSRGDDRQLSAIRALLQQVDILNEIASSFSAFARMPAPVVERVDVSVELKKAAALYASDHRGVVRIEHLQTDTAVMADPALLSRVFSNLILNALQSREEGQVEVVVRLEKEEKAVRIIVDDNGPGIDAAMREKIFQPHFTTKKSGSGLGLAIARQGLSQSGGSIDYEPLPGGGSRFIVNLPLA
jgi:two-component system nitrogen regulation sensor histidine kinase NtrY